METHSQPDEVEKGGNSAKIRTASVEKPEMKIYTKTGDEGSTGLPGGERVSKSHARIEALGSLDELNAMLGYCMKVGDGSACHLILSQLQDMVFEVGCEVAAGQRDDRMAVGLETLTTEMEEWIDAHTERMAPLKNFVLPGGSELSCRLHLARAICRRAEREIVLLEQESPGRPIILAFVNRLSDWLFCAARYANQESGIADVEWRKA